MRVMTTTTDIIFEELPSLDGAIGSITLNRPQALNALSHAMCIAMYHQLQTWQDTPSIKAVIIRGTGDKAFCAGGDIRQLYDYGKQGELHKALAFFHDEYRLNLYIANFSKPYIAFVDGITMGGGMGVSIHGSHRVGTERLMMAMPETGIGFFPDIGGTYFLPRCPDEIGIYLGLTGARMNAADALDAGLIDQVVPSHTIDTIIATLLNTEFSTDAHASVTEVLQAFTITTEPSVLSNYRDFIEACFKHDTVESIILALKNHESPWTEQTLTTLKQKSPTSLKVTLKALRRGLIVDLATCLQMEYRLCEHFMQSHDFYEGVRALIVDKDKNPQWLPVTLDKVTHEIVDSYFEKL
jgi:enoyl-CoA hydratase/carnithine racemase